MIIIHLHMSYYSLVSVLISVIGITPFTYIMLWMEGIKSHILPYPTHPLSFTIVPLIVFYFVAEWCEQNSIPEKSYQARKRYLDSVPFSSS